MSEREKLALLEDMLELEEGDLSAEMNLSDVEEWNSMAKLSLIVLMSDEFGKKISGEDIKEFHTIGDILEEMC